MNMTWDEYFCRMLHLVASKSKDASTKVGAIIVGPDHEIRSTGYNGLPRGVHDLYNHSRYDRPAKYLWTEHAERNAIYNAARVGIPISGCTIYQSFHPCSDCARGIIQSGIVEVVIANVGLDDKWTESTQVGIDMFIEAGVRLRVIEPISDPMLEIRKHVDDRIRYWTETQNGDSQNQYVAEYYLACLRDVKRNLKNK